MIDSISTRGSTELGLFPKQHSNIETILVQYQKCVLMLDLLTWYGTNIVPTSGTDRPRNYILSQYCNNIWCQHLDWQYWVNVVSIWAKFFKFFWYGANIAPILANKTEFGSCYLIWHQYCTNIKVRYASKYDIKPIL